MRKLLFLAAALVLAGVLAPRGANACLAIGPGYPVHPCPPLAYHPYPYPYYVAPPAVSFGSWWDPDYRAIRYNHYFQRHRSEPRIQGFTLR